MTNKKKKIEEENEYTVDVKVPNLKASIKAIEFGMSHVGENTNVLKQIRDVCDQMIKANTGAIRIMDDGAENMKGIMRSSRPKKKSDNDDEPKFDYKTTAKHFKIYKEHAKKWIKYFGLMDWEFVFQHQKFTDRAEDWLAANSSGTRAKQATISLNKNWFGDEPTVINLQRCAFHEVFETMTSELRNLVFDLLNDKFVTETQVSDANHSLIQRMVNTVWEPLKDKI